MLVVDKDTKQYELEQRPLTSSEIARFVGAFKFLDLEAYEFVGREELADGENLGFDPAVMKGG
mgnify:CR=1 FL=1